MNKKSEWILEVKSAENGRAEAVEFGLTLEGKKSGQRVSVIPARTGIDAFEEALSELKTRLTDIGGEARRRLEQLLTESAGSKPAQPGDFWQQMVASGSDQDMFERFNALGEETRAAVAEYVFTHVSMFSGKGPVFAEHYNAGTHILE